MSSKVLPNDLHEAGARRWSQYVRRRLENLNQFMLHTEIFGELMLYPKLQD